MYTHEVELALDKARDYVLDHFINGGDNGRKRDASDIESYGDWAVDKLPEEMKQKLQPARPDPDLVKQAKSVLSSVVRFLQDNRGTGSPKDLPSWPLEVSYTQLAGTLRLIEWEKQSVGSCLRATIEGSDDVWEFEEMADEFREIMEHRYKETEKLSQNDRIIRDTNSLISKALSFVKDNKHLEPIKETSSGFRGYVKSLKEPENEDALSR